MTIEYWNELAKQMLLISSLLGGFSITIVANLATLSAGCFLVTVFAMFDIIMITTEGILVKMF